MSDISISGIVLFVSAFLLITLVLELLSQKTSFPYSVAALISGLVIKVVSTQFNIHIPDIDLTEFIYFVLLPILLFDSSIRINFHQFKLQLKTISILSTLGLIISVIIVGCLFSLFFNITILQGLLFGAIISATDPIAVISIFKSLGAPKRLALIAEGESMFNDATGVIVFRLISGFVFLEGVIGPHAFIEGLIEFIIVVALSVSLGILVGVICNFIIDKIYEDRIAETTITAIAAIFSFVFADHFLHASGVIACVTAGLVIGNWGHTKFSNSSFNFINHFWEFLGFFSISIVFFSAALKINWSDIFNNLGPILLAIAVVQFARAISTYSNFIISNYFSFFKNEPNVPLKWQHILNWGGLRGVIPLVLVYTLPDDFALKEQFLIFTLSILLFTIIFNGTTISYLIKLLNINKLPEEKLILKSEDQVLKIKNQQKILNKLKASKFDPELLNIFEKQLEDDVKYHNRYLNVECSIHKLKVSLQLRSIELERKKVDYLLNHDLITEAVYYKFQSELDLQQDAIDFPEISKSRSYKEGGFVESEAMFNNAINRLEKLKLYPSFLGKFFNNNEIALIKNRILLLETRILSSEYVIENFNTLNKELSSKKLTLLIADEILRYKARLKRNKEHLKDLLIKYPHIFSDIQKQFISSSLVSKNVHKL